MTSPSIRALLERIGAIDGERVTAFASHTRDREIPVWHDPVSGVIFIDDFYVGDAQYASGGYRHSSSGFDFEDHCDTQRRVTDLRSLYFGRRVLDFGCGAGNFLRTIKDSALHVQGVELQDSFRNRLVQDGIECFDSIAESSAVDIVFMFHVLEHLPDPVEVLREIRTKISGENGVLVVEVPHAKAFLITVAQCQSFIDFTLWSQHLILHTHDSLNRILAAAGFRDIQVRGVQRYGLANHMKWLAKGEPGGHKDTFSLFETPALNQQYCAALAAMNATDTLIATAK